MYIAYSVTQTSVWLSYLTLLHLSRQCQKLVYSTKDKNQISQKMYIFWITISQLTWLNMLSIISRKKLSATIGPLLYKRLTRFLICILSKIINKQFQDELFTFNKRSLNY